ncbi:hypothetical protein [Mycobacterium sp.]|uniref:hypothetical protein n=1 Tax=Mycobacterium sp. TaxID=1785 RepID=UPI003BAF8C13
MFLGFVRKFRTPVPRLETYGDSSTAAAAETTSLADLTTAGDSGDLLTDLLSAMDPGAAADSGNLLTDLASLF